MILQKNIKNQKYYPQEVFEINLTQCADDDKIGIDGTRDSPFPKEVQIGRQN